MVLRGTRLLVIVLGGLKGARSRIHRTDGVLGLLFRTAATVGVILVLVFICRNRPQLSNPENVGVKALKVKTVRKELREKAKHLENAELELKAQKHDKTIEHKGALHLLQVLLVVLQLFLLLLQQEQKKRTSLN